MGGLNGGYVILRMLCSGYCYFTSTGCIASGEIPSGHLPQKDVLTMALGVYYRYVEPEESSVFPNWERVPKVVLILKALYGLVSTISSNGPENKA